MNAWAGGILLAGFALAATVLATRKGLRLGGTASAAARPRSPLTTAAALCSEHLSSATLLAFAGLVFIAGPIGLWPAAALGAGYLLLLRFVVAPLRRARVYSLSDFAEWRLGRRAVRRVVSLCVVATGCLYLLAQFVIVGTAARTLTGVPEAVGWVALVAVVLPVVLGGTIGSGTGFHALHFWLVFGALAAPLPVLAIFLLFRGAPGEGAPVEAVPALPLPATVSVFLAIAVGTMGLPQFAARLYGTPDAVAARRAVARVFGLMAVFVLVPVGYGLLARAVGSRAGEPGGRELVMLTVPGQVAEGAAGAALTALVAAGAALATIGFVLGLITVLGGMISQCVLGGGVGTFRIGVLLAVLVPPLILVCCPPAGRLDAGVLVAAAFQLSAVTVAPMLLLGIWWRGLTDVGVAAGMLVGLAATPVAKIAAAAPGLSGQVAALLVHPALFLLPLVVAVMVVVSLSTARRIPPWREAAMRRMHDPEGGKPALRN